MELTLNQKHDLLARLAAQTHPSYDPDCHVTLEDMLTELAKDLPAGAQPSRNIATRLLKDAAARGEMVEGWAVRGGKKIRVYTPVAANVNGVTG